MAAFKYRFADGAVHKVDAGAVGEACEKIEREYGTCTPQRLLDYSLDPLSPLHNEFDWDDSIAAEKWRLEQARLLIAHVRIIYADDESERKEYKERGFVSSPGRQHAYVSMNTALSNEVYKKHLLEQAKRECMCFIAKYRRLQELAGVITEMEKIVGAV